jgi:hypothetical protein
MSGFRSTALPRDCLPIKSVSQGIGSATFYRAGRVGRKLRPDWRGQSENVQTALRAVAALDWLENRGAGVVPDRNIVSVGLGLLPPNGTPRGIYVHFHGRAWVLCNARLDDGITSGGAR